MQRKPITPENALCRLETLCARGEHCEYELRRKLITWGISDSDREKIIKSLRVNRFVDDARYARSFVNDKYRFAGHGRYKIRLALMAKRIDRDIIDNALSEIDQEIYEDKLHHILKTKLARTADSDTFEGRTKIYRFGVSRGFEPELVSRHLREIIKASKDC